MATGTATAPSTNGARVVWAPQPGGQVQFLTCHAYEALFAGTRGSGKTDALLMAFAQWCGRGFKAAWRGIVFRRSYPELADLVAKSKRWFFQIWPGIKYNESDHSWHWPTGEALLFRYIENADDYWNYHGHEYPFVAFEELTNWPNLDAYHAMKSCCRSSVKGLPRMVRATANPYGVGHNVVKAYFVDPAPPGTVIQNAGEQSRVFIHADWRENVALTSADPDYIRNLQSDTNEARRRAWLLGDWDIVAGGMFDDLWHEAQPVLAPFPVPADWRIDRAFDWGSAKPWACVWTAEANGETVKTPAGDRTFPRGTLIVIGEEYGWNGQPNEGARHSTDEIARRIKAAEARMGIADRVRPGPADTAIWDVMDGRSIADQLTQAGVRFTKAWKGKGSRVNGWSLLRNRLAANTQRPMEKPGWFVFDTCRHIIRTMPSAPRDGKNPDDLDTQYEDHLLDAARYRCLEPARTMRVGEAVWG